MTKQHICEFCHYVPQQNRAGVLKVFCKIATNGGQSALFLKFQFHLKINLAPTLLKYVGFVNACYNRVGNGVLEVFCEKATDGVKWSICSVFYQSKLYSTMHFVL